MTFSWTCMVWEGIALEYLRSWQCLRDALVLFQDCLTLLWLDHFCHPGGHTLLDNGLREGSQVD